MLLLPTLFTLSPMILQGSMKGLPNWEWDLKRIEALLQEKNPNLEITDRFEQAPLFWAARSKRFEILKELLDHNANPNVTAFEELATPLHVAVQDFVGYLDTVKMLLDHNANPNASDRDSRTPLHFAVMLRRLDIIQALLDHNANPNASDRNQRTPFHEAAEIGERKIIQALLDHNANPNAFDSDQRTPLHFFVRQGDLETVQMLLDHHNANPNADPDPGDWHDTPLHDAVRWGKHKIVKVLLDHNATPDRPGGGGRTALHIAAEMGEHKIVQALLDHNANPNASDSYQQTPLHGAAREGHLEVVEILLDHNAKPDESNSDRATPLSQAAESGHVDIVRTLLVHNANPNLADFLWTPLELAVVEGHLDIVKIFLDHEANPNSFHSSDKKTPLHQAAEKGHVDIVGTFLDYHASPNASDSDQQTPLHKAASEGQRDVVEILLGKGADSTLQDKDGQTAIDLAIQNKRAVVVEYLKARQTGVFAQVWIWYANQLALKPLPAIIAHLPFLLFVWALLSLSFCKNFAHLPVLRLPLELDVFLRKHKSRLVSIFLQQLRHDLMDSFHRNKVHFTPLPLIINGAPSELTTHSWIASIPDKIDRGSHFRAALAGGGGTGKTVMLQNLTLSLIQKGYVPVFFPGAGYAGQPSLTKWLEARLEVAQVPVRPALWARLPNVVYINDQASEVPSAHHNTFWDLLRSQFDSGNAPLKLIVGGRFGQPMAGSKNTACMWEEYVEPAELKDQDIKILGSAYLDPLQTSKGKQEEETNEDSKVVSEEIQTLPSTIRSIMPHPSAFVVSHYAQARRSSTRSIRSQGELYEEILDSHTANNALQARPAIVKGILKGLVANNFIKTHDPGLPEKDTLIGQVQGIITTQELPAKYGRENIPLPVTFVDHLLPSGLVYPTHKRYLFFHDSFEDWLAGEFGE